MFDKYLYALGRGIRGVREALEEQQRASEPDPAKARDITPPKPQMQPAPTIEMRPDGTTVSGPVAGTPLDGALLGSRVLVMGIVNVTPDSFSDGGRFADTQRAIDHGIGMVEDGADIVDVGGESTRPGAIPVSAEEELERILPVIRGIAASTRTPVSADTMKAAVAAAAIDAGARIVNDVWGFQFDPEMVRVVAANGVHCVLMHNRETDDPSVDMFAEVRDFLSRSVDLALGAGVAQDHIILDPGIGFGKTNDQSLEMVRRLGELKRHFDMPVLLGLSRKRMIGNATGRPAGGQRDPGTLAANLFGIEQGADIIRVHNVPVHVDALKVRAALLGSSAREG